MKISEYKQISTEVVKSIEIVNDYDENGEIIGSHEVEVEKEVPVMGMVVRDMTDEEVAEMESMQIEEVEEETTIDDVVEALQILTDIVLNGGE